MHKKELNRGVILTSKIAITAVTSLSLAGVVGLHSVAQAQQPSPPIFENVTLAPNFSPDPLTVRGLSGGSVPGKDVAGRSETVNGPCAGFVDAQPDHTLVLTGFFNYLSLQVQSPEDTIIIVRGPGGTWCNDDIAGKNPGIAGQWLAGTYSVWVGSYKQTEFPPYILQISKTP